MARVLAITNIVEVIEPGKRGDKEKGIKPIPPKSRTIKAGTVLHVSGEREAELRRLEAIRDIQPGEQISVPVDKVFVSSTDDDETRAAVGKEPKASKAPKAPKAPKAKAEGAAKTESQTSDAGKPADDDLV